MLGSHVVPLLREAGRPVRILARNRREPAPGIEYRSCDLLEGAGLDEAVKDVETVFTWRAAPRTTTRRPGTWCRPRARPGCARHLVCISEHRVLRKSCSRPVCFPQSKGWAMESG
ncbi:hypothetical protein ACFYWU_26445 [Streptomyces chrestomyceticus]|uniref:hypothetical protein n=1 Tax=Streptomyces chrestomyceticus TaxID=68185 RepID=UPI003692BD99